MTSWYLLNAQRRLNSEPRSHLRSIPIFIPPKVEDPKPKPIPRSTRIDRAVTLALGVCTFTALGFLAVSAWVFEVLK